MRDAYGVRAADLAYLPIGADRNTTAYRLVAADGAAYFLKLRSGPFNPASVEIQPWLREHGLAQVIEPISTVAGQPWTRVGEYAVVLYPFVEGQSGMQRPLSDPQWIELGEALKRLHGMGLPSATGESIPREAYADHFRAMVRGFMRQAEDTVFDDPIAGDLAAMLRARRETVLDLVSRAELHATALKQVALELVLCHADIHAANVMVADDGRLFIVDWDTLLYAPKERDLMFIGAGVGRVWRDERERTLFYTGYGATQVDPTALAYYRYERIVEDIAEYADQALSSDADETERARALQRLAIQLEPGNVVIGIAYATDAAGA